MWECDEPMALVAGVSRGKALERALARVPKELLSLSELELERRASPSKCDRLLKANLWNLVRESWETGGTFRARDLHGDICTYTHLRDRVLSSPLRLAWMIGNRMLAQRPDESLRSIAVEQLYVLLQRPVVRSGKVDYRQAELVLRVWVALHDRLYGCAERISPERRAGSFSQTRNHK